MESFLKHLVRMRIVEQSLQATYLHLGLHGLGFPIILRLRSLDTDSLPLSKLDRIHPDWWQNRRLDRRSEGECDERVMRPSYSAIPLRLWELEQQSDLQASNLPLLAGALPTAWLCRPTRLVIQYGYPVLYVRRTAQILTQHQAGLWYLRA